jgi:hypothetical protein
MSVNLNNIVVLNQSRLRDPYQDLSDDDLLNIIKTDKFEHLYDQYRPYLCSPELLFRAPYAEAYDAALEHAIDNSSTPVDAFFYGTLVVPVVGDIALGILTGAYGLTAALGAYNYFSGRKQYNKAKLEDIHYFQLAQLQLIAADEFKTRVQREVGCSDEDFPVVHDECKSVPKAPTFFSKLRHSTLKGLGTGFTLSVGYYLSAAWILETIQFTAVSAAMLTPVGLGIAIGLAVLIGIYCGYKHYKSLEANHVIVEQKAVLAHKVQLKRDESVHLSGFKQGFFRAKQTVDSPENVMNRNFVVSA